LLIRGGGTVNIYYKLKKRDRELRKGRDRWLKERL